MTGQERKHHDLTRTIAHCNAPLSHSLFSCLPCCAPFGSDGYQPMDVISPCLFTIEICELAFFKLFHTFQGFCLMFWLVWLGNAVDPCDPPQTLRVLHCVKRFLESYGGVMNLGSCCCVVSFPSQFSMMKCALRCR